MGPYLVILGLGGASVLAGWGVGMLCGWVWWGDENRFLRAQLDEAVNVLASKHRTDDESHRLDALIRNAFAKVPAGGIK